MADDKILYEVKDKIAWITLNRPESLNAVNRDMVKSIVEYCRRAEEDLGELNQLVIATALAERGHATGVGDFVQTPVCERQPRLPVEAKQE